MKATLYAVRCGAAMRWEWRTSVCMDADFAFWRNRGEGAAGLWLAVPSLSFGQAEKVRRLLEQRNTSSEGTPQHDLSSLFSENLPFPIPKLVMRHMDLFAAFRQAVPIDETLYFRLMDKLSGRLLLPEDALALAEHHELGLHGDMRALLHYIQLGRLRGDLMLEPGIRETAARGSRWWGQWSLLRGRPGSSTIGCLRCGSRRLHLSDCPHCGGECPYCEDCLAMGRVRSCSPLIGSVNKVRLDRLAAGGFGDPESYIRPWELSDAQAAASRAGLAFIAMPGRKAAAADAAEPEAFLVWAVTGAGKTEMIFPFLSATIARGGRALVATPRKDVVLELSPRVQRAFPQAHVVTLYGGSEQRWDTGEIVIATTHQLLRFRHAFDLVVIDELDAFPFHNNPMLNYAARHACNPRGKYILLSATPPPEMQRAARWGRLPHAKVPVRYHRHPLPVPAMLVTSPLKRMLEGQRLAKPLHHAILSTLRREAQLFVFVPGIAFVEPLVTLLKHNFLCKIQGTSSKDPERAEKIVAFREGRTRILVTTTILERGVTVPKTDVIVLDADSRLFDEASLVQMAGRAGRSKLDPAGIVLFAARDRTRPQLRAVRQIRRMNRLARRSGYLLHQ